MKIKRDFRLLLLGRKPGQVLDFDNFTEVVQTLELLRKKEYLEKTGVIRKFRSMNDVYTGLQNQKAKKIRRKLRKNGPFLTSESDAKKRSYDLKMYNSYADLLNEKGKIRVSGETYNLLKSRDMKQFSDQLSLAYREYVQRKGIVEDIICHQFHESDLQCVSINKDTMLPSFEDAHVEHWPHSSYITRYFDVTANGKLTRIQMWKGHLLALNFTGGEISVWKPDRKLVIEWNFPLDVTFVWKEFFGKVWYPYMNNQLHISWELIDKNSGRSFLSYGDNSAYEGQLKWWAGKWLTHGDGLDLTRKGEEMVMRYKISDDSGILAEGER